MYRDLYGSSSADLMSDSFEGLGARAVVNEFRSAHGMQPVASEIPPEAAISIIPKVTPREEFPLAPVASRARCGTH